MLTFGRYTVKNGLRLSKSPINCRYPTVSVVFGRASHRGRVPDPAVRDVGVVQYSRIS
jgi:hypothetical protein